MYLLFYYVDSVQYSTTFVQMSLMVLYSSSAYETEDSMQSVLVRGFSTMDARNRHQPLVYRD